MSANAPRAHGHGFDYLRLFAAALVVFGHAHALTAQPGPGFAANGVQTIGLKIFFVLSGYLVSVSWLSDPHIPRFLMRRILRIFPALIVVVAVSALVLGPLLTTLSWWEYFKHPTTWLYFSNVLLNIRYSLPGVFSANTYPHAINGSLWSLPVEFVMYIVGPALILVTGARRKTMGQFAYTATTVLIAGASLFLLRVQPMPAPRVVYGTNVWYILELAPYFLIGGAYAVLRLEKHVDLGIALALVLLLAMFPLPGALQEGLLYLVLPYACLALGRSPTPSFSLAGRAEIYPMACFSIAFLRSKSCRT